MTQFSKRNKCCELDSNSLKRRQWSRDSEEASFRVADFFASFLLYTEQSAIDWHQILYGRFSTEWSVIQSQEEPRHGAGWQSQTICAIWTILQELWFLRNNHLHVDSPAALEPIRDRLLHASVTNLFDLQPALTELDQQLFPATLTQTLALPRSTLSTWLNLAHPAVDAALASLPLESSHLPISPSLSPASSQ